MMTKRFKLPREFFILLATIATIAIIVIVTLTQVIALKVTEPVTDYAGVLTPEQKVQLTNQINLIEKNTSVEIAILITNNISDDTVLFASQVGEISGVGKKGQDNGIVIFWDTSQNAGAIATGRGIESTIPDATALQVGREAKPYFLNNSYYEGFSLILARLQSKFTAAPPGGTPISTQDIIIFIIILFVGVMLVAWLLSKDDSGTGLIGAATGAAVGSSFGSGSSGSSGGFNFGGGSFGGGGAKF